MKLNEKSEADLQYRKKQTFASGIGNSEAVIQLRKFTFTSGRRQQQRLGTDATVSLLATQFCKYWCLPPFGGAIMLPDGADHIEDVSQPRR